MKRDMELIRKLLLAVEELPPAGADESMAVDGYAKDLVQAHIGLLVESGLVRAMPAHSKDGDDWLVKGLSPRGHDTVASMRDDKVWRKVWAYAAPKVGTMTFEAALVYIKAEVTKHLGAS